MAWSSFLGVKELCPSRCCLSLHHVSDVCALVSLSPCNPSRQRIASYRVPTLVWLIVFGNTRCILGLIESVLWTKRKGEPRAKVSAPAGQPLRRVLAGSPVGLSARGSKLRALHCGPSCAWIMENQTAAHKNAEIRLCSSFMNILNLACLSAVRNEAWGFLEDEWGGKKEKEKKKDSGKFLKRKKRHMLPHLFFHDQQKVLMFNHAVPSKNLHDKIPPPVLLYFRALVTLSLYFKITSLNT